MLQACNNLNRRYIRLPFTSLRLREDFPMSSSSEITVLLVEWSNGNKEALDQLLPLVEKELHRLAHSYMRRERPNHTLQTTALIHETYVRLVDQRNVQWQNRAHFFGIAAQLMRRILTNYARTRHRAKRGGRAIQVSLSEVAIISDTRSAELIALDEALDRLSAIDETKGENRRDALLRRVECGRDCRGTWRVPDHSSSRLENREGVAFARDEI